jgi:amino acid adenylation domain-containing protein
LSNQELPFDRVVEELAPDRNLAGNPLFNVMFTYLNEEGQRFALPGLAAEPVPVARQTAKFDLSLDLVRLPDGSLAGELEYPTALFDRTTVERIAGHYCRLLHAIAAAPQRAVAELAILGPDELARLRDLARGPAAATDTAAPLHERFHAWARTSPERVAVRSCDSVLTYAELDARADRLAEALRAAGVQAGREARVAVCVERAPEAVVAFLAVLKAGAVYAPLDPEHPAQRRQVLLAELDAAALVTQRRLASRLAPVEIPVIAADDCGPDRSPRDQVAPPHPQHAAYVIFTSGSTGRPKGVMITHQALTHHTSVIAEVYGIRPDDRILLMAPLTFDVSVEQMAMALAHGATLVVGEAQIWTPETLLDRIAELGVTYLELTPTYYRELMAVAGARDPRLAGLRMINVGSDRVTAHDARIWHDGGYRGAFVCTYGPTEATVVSTWDEPTEADRTAASTIGRPVPGTTAYVLDPAMNPVPVGVPGELYLAGIRLARGYLNSPRLTAERFLPDPFAAAGGRLYRTGDRVRYLSTGTIEFLGRTDYQVKVRGYRIETGEVEAALNDHPDVAAAAVVARELEPGDSHLVAYVVPRPGAGLDVRQLRAFLADRLPAYMVPSGWLALDVLPVTASGKVDRRRLPAPASGRAAAAATHAPPLSGVEGTIAGVWADILGVDGPGRHDNFFDLGGHSLHVIKVMSRLQRAFSVDLSVKDMFAAQTIADLAELVEARSTSD